MSSILEKITPGKWSSEGIHIKAEGKTGRIGQSFLIQIPSYDNKFSECQESIANAKVWAASKEALSIIERLAQWQRMPAKDKQEHMEDALLIANDAQTLLNELNK
jgi:hypothetical protein